MTRDEIPGWFYKDREAVLEQLIKDHNIKTVIEVGTFLGKSAAFFAERCEKVYCIDPFVLWEEGKKNGDTMKWAKDENFFEQFWNYMVELGLQDKVVPLIGTSEAVALREPNLKADMVYIDGAHDYESVSRDIQLWRNRGIKIVCGDDYDNIWPQVKGAVTMFMPGAQVKNGVWYRIL